jgi:hypothetical protein
MAFEVVFSVIATVAVCASLCAVMYSSSSTPALAVAVVTVRMAASGSANTASAKPLACSSAALHSTFNHLCLYCIANTLQTHTHCAHTVLCCAVNA